jgi:tetratricopeptide (TPR) repeat protein
MAMGGLAGALRVIEEADSLLGEAARRDPGFLEATVERGELARDRAILLVPGDSAGHRQALEMARAHAERVLAVDSENAQALALRGRVAFEQSASELQSAPRRRELLDAAWRDLSAAVGRHPEPAGVYRTLAEVQAARGELADALQLALRAREYDTFLQVDAESLRQLFALSFDLGRDGQAERWCTEGRRRFPANWIFFDCRLRLLGWAEDGEPGVSADAVRDSALDLVPAAFRDAVAAPLDILVAASYARSGDRTRARDVLLEYESQSISGLDVSAAGVWLMLGQRAKALERLRAYVQAVPAQAELLRHRRILEPLREDPDFRTLTAPPERG